MPRAERSFGFSGCVSALVGLAVGVACAHAPASVTPPPPVAVAPIQVKPIEVPSIVPADERNPSAEQVANILSHAGFDFATVTPGKRWRVTFAGHRQPTVTVDVVYSDHFTTVVGKLFNMPATSDNDVYKAIAERNFDLEQMKLSVDPQGAVFASFEVPTRIMDRRELLENIISLAAALDSLKLDAPVLPEPAPRPETPTPPAGGIQKIRATPPLIPERIL